MEIDVKDETGLTVIALKGSFDAKSAREFRDAVLEAVRNGKKHLLVDFLGVDQMDGFALSAIVGIYCKLTESAGTLALSGMNPEIREFLERTCLGKVFPLYYDKNEAIRGGRPPAEGAPTPGGDARSAPLDQSAGEFASA